MFALLCMLSLVATGPSAPPLTTTDPPPAPLARQLIVTADDFVVDVYYNGARLPDSERTLLAEIHGATVERMNVEVRPGDWLVFHVVNNRLRWGGVRYFAACGLNGASDGPRVGFTTELTTGRWTCCDDPLQVPRFIADPAFLARNGAQAIDHPWSEGDGLMNRYADGWPGTPLWGRAASTWIRFETR